MLLSPLKWAWGQGNSYTHQPESGELWGGRGGCQGPSPFRLPSLSSTCQFLRNRLEFLRTDVHILVSVQRGKEKEAICPQDFQCRFLLGRKGLSIASPRGPKLPIPVPEAGRQLLPDTAAPAILFQSPRHTCQLICSNVASQQSQSSLSPFQWPAGPSFTPRLHPLSTPEFPPSPPKGPVLLFTRSWPLSPPASPLPLFPGAG